MNKLNTIEPIIRKSKHINLIFNQFSIAINNQIFKGRDRTSLINFLLNFESIKSNFFQSRK